jgi:hypothetical protein
MAAFLFELRQVIASLRRRPAVFLVTCSTLDIGFAAHLTALTIVDRLLLAMPAHVRDDDRVFRLHVDRALTRLEP